MNRASWQARIRRAEELASQYPAAAELLRFYGQVANFQKGVYERLQKQNGDPQIRSLESDFPALLQLVKRIGPAPLAARAGELEAEHRSFTAWLEMEAPPDLLFFTRALLQPLAESRSNRMAATAMGSSARCPACGEWPQTAALRGEGDGAKRWLVCSLCCGEWEFRRIVCPRCGEEDKEQLPVYTSPTFEHARVEACERCRCYVKAIDLTKNGLAVPCVDDLASVALDLWAEERGYEKLQRNLLGL